MITVVKNDSGEKNEVLQRDAQLVWKLGKASLRKAVFKMFKPVADLVKRKGKRLEERGARERKRQKERPVCAKA